VKKTCDIGTDTTPDLTACAAGAETHDVVYTVKVTNTTPTGEGGVVVDQICDNQYGNVFTATGFSGPDCPAGTTGTVATTTCSSSLPGDIANQGSGSCTFTVSHGENLSVTDQVTVNGHSDLVSTTTFPAKMSNTVTVTSTDAPTTAMTSLGLEPGPQAACVTLRYDVTVANTSAADESITLDKVVSPYTPALRDDVYGDLSMLSGSASVDKSIVGTTCGIATGQPGLGTLSTGTVHTFPATLAPGTGTPPTNNGGTYMCQFDGVICGAPSRISTTCAFGLQKADLKGVKANLTGDDTGLNADTITETDNPFTASVCLVQTGQ
jgi:hypothetical protein